MALQQQKCSSPNTSAERLSNVEMALEALRNVIRNNPGVEIQCIGHFKLLFSLLRVDGRPKMQQHALEVVSCVTANQECINDIAASEVMAYLLLVIQMLPQFVLLTLEVLYPLTSNTKILKELVNKGALIYLLDLYCNATNPSVREKTAELFAKLLSDKLNGPKVRILLAKFLPSIFMDAMRDSPEASVHMFESTHENPELIWNDQAREKVCGVVKQMKDEHFRAQLDNPVAKWNLSEGFAVVYTDIEGELIIGGVFLRLFIANPGWVLRKPKEFIVELLEKWSEITSIANPNVELLETVTSGVVAFFTAQPSMLDQVPQLGHIPKIFKVMTSRNDCIPKSSLLIVQQLSASEVCIRAMAQIDCIGPMKIAMKIRRDMISVACDAYMKMFQLGEEELVEQALKTETIQFLVALLETGLESQENPAATKAQIVKAVKAMQLSLKHGEQIREILEKYPIWKEYKDQKHDLFLNDRPVSGYLTGPGVAGYLTSGSSTSASSMPNVPPPMS
jgi:DnaJ family protein C protein 13